LGVAAAMTFGAAETEAAPITGAGDTPRAFPSMGRWHKAKRTDWPRRSNRTTGCRESMAIMDITAECTGGPIAGRGDTFAEPIGDRIITERFGAV
jgi:hypothetical protein